MDCGYDAELLVPEENDVPLRERVRRANAHCDALGPSDVLLVSIHVNAAAADGKWHNATGWSSCTTPRITKSNLSAQDLYRAAAVSNRCIPQSTAEQLVQLVQADIHRMALAAWQGIVHNVQEVWNLIAVDASQPHKTPLRVDCHISSNKIRKKKMIKS